MRVSKESLNMFLGDVIMNEDNFMRVVTTKGDVLVVHNDQCFDINDVFDDIKDYKISDTSIIINYNCGRILTLSDETFNDITEWLQ